MIGLILAASLALGGQMPGAPHHCTAGCLICKPATPSPRAQSGPTFGAIPKAHRRADHSCDGRCGVCEPAKVVVPVVPPVVAPVAPASPTVWLLADASGQRWTSTDYHGLIAQVRAVNARLAYRPAYRPTSPLGGYYRVRGGSACANGACR